MFCMFKDLENIKLVGVLSTERLRKKMLGHSAFSSMMIHAN